MQKNIFLKQLTKQLIAGSMSLSLVLQPMLARAQITADPNAGNVPNIGVAPNGVPMVDIVAPNASGLSHNKYHDFNIGQPGVILNNHNTEQGTSQLGGVTPGNPNLRGTNGASVILNEVTSGNRSQLEGPAEVFGRQADVIIANPNGITCDGCGFINTPRATLTTGLPQIGVDGVLSGFDVKGGDVTFGSKGANLSSGQGSVDIFDVVSRTVRINGSVSGRDVGITAGSGKFDYASREMKELTDITGKPEYAIDGSALGALQADRIKVVATEKGVGVRMRNDMAANAGEVSLSADGKITLNNVSGRDGVKIKSNQSSVEAQRVTSKSNVNIQAEKAIVLKTIGADGDVFVNTRDLLSVEGDVLAQGNVTLQAAAKINAGQVASDQSLNIQAGQGIDILIAVAKNQANLRTQAGDIAAQNGISAQNGDLTIHAVSGAISAATLLSFNNMTLQAGGDLNIIGNVLAGNDLTANIGRNIRGDIVAGGVDLTKTNESGSLQFFSRGSVALTAQNGAIVANNIYSVDSLNISTANALQVANTIASAQNVNIIAASIQAGRSIAGSNLAGTNNELNVNATTSMTTNGDIAIGNIFSGGNIALNMNNGSLTTNQLYSSSAIDVSALQGSMTIGQYSAQGDVHLNAGNSLSLTGQSYSAGNATFASSTFTANDITTAGNLSLTANSATANRFTVHGNARIIAANSDIKSLLSGGDITIDGDKIALGTAISGIDFVASQKSKTGDVALKSEGKLTLNATDTIVATQLISANDFSAKAGTNITYGTILSYGDAALKSDNGALSLENRLAAKGDISLAANSLDLSNNRTTIQTAKNLYLKGNDVNLSNSTLVYGGVHVVTPNQLNVENTKLLATTQNGGSGDISLSASQLALTNQSDIIANRDLTLTLNSLDNSAQLAAGRDLTLKVLQNITNQNTGLIYAGNDGALFANGDIINNFGAIQAGNDLKLANYDGSGKNQSVINKAGLIQAGNDLSILTSLLRNEADSTPEFATRQETGAEYAFDKPEKYELLGLGSKAKWLGILYWDSKKNGWGTGKSRPKESGQHSGHGADGVFWLHAGIYANKEEAYGTATVGDTTYKSFTWSLAGSHNSDRWYAWDNNAKIAETSETQYFTNKPSKQGLIQAGGKLTIDATTIENKYSAIEAGENANIKADHLQNIGVTLYKTTYHSCIVGSTCEAYDADGTRNTSKDIAAGTSVFIGKTVSDSLSSVIKAGGALNLDVQTLDNSAADGSIAGNAHYEATGSSGNPLDALNGLTAGSALFTPKVDFGSDNNGDVDTSLSTAIQNGQISAPKPQSGGFGGTLPNQNFIYETRAEFLDVGKFYGSSYFLNRIGYQPDREIYFLGDAYFEKELVEKQLRDLINQGFGKGSFIPGNDAIEQMKTLLDNGADYTASHGLAFGEPLTEEQIAALDKSIVIYVKQIYKGAEVYAPVVYLSASDKEKAVASGAMIAGGSVNITTDTITNSGLIQSSSSLKVEGVNIVANGGGFASQGDLMLAASGNLELNAGKTLFNGQEVVVATDAVSAGGTAILKSDQDVNLAGVGVSAGENLGIYGQNVNIGTATATASNGSQNVTGSKLQSGNITQIKADENVVVTGSSVHADGALNIAADNGSLIVQSATADRLKTNGNQSTQQQSNLSSGGSALLTAGEDIVIAGSNVHADKDLGLKADGSISVIATTNSGTTTISDKKSQFNSSETTLTGSSLSADNNIVLQAGSKDNAGNINIVASDVAANGQTTLAATGNVNILAGEETSSYDGKSSSKGSGLFGSKKSNEAHRDETTLVGSNISGGKGVNVISDGDTTISASNILAGDKDNTADVNISAGGNIVVASGLETSSSSSKQNSKGFLSSSSKNKNTYDETSVASTIAATGDVNLYADEHIAVSGSNLIANEDINLSGSSVSVIGAQENHHLDEKKKQTGFGVGSGEGFYSLYGSQSKATTKDQTNNIASNLSAGENVNILARDSDVNIVGSNIDAGYDINIDAARDVNITPGSEAYAESENKKRSGFGVQLQHTNSSASVGIGFASATDKKSEDHSVNSKPNLNAGNDVNINAGRDANLQAANVDAWRDVNIAAVNDVNLLAANDTSNYNEMHERLFVGVTASVSSNVASAVETISNSVDRAGKGKGAEGVANLAIAGANTYGALGNLDKAWTDAKALAGGQSFTQSPGVDKNGKPISSIYEQGNLINNTISVGFNHSKSQSSSEVSTPVVTQIDAGRSVNIKAEEGSVNGVGTQIYAGTSNPIWQLIGDDKAGDINISAGNEINFVSAVGSQKSDSKSTALGLQVGIDLKSVNGYYNNGKSENDGTYHVNSHITGTGDITLQSNNNANFIGAVVTGNSIKADIGGDLNIVSPVDTQQVDIKNTSISGGIGNNTASFDYTKQKGSGNSQTIPEQSGFHAGDGGFDIKVNGNTDLTGGVITSTADESKNRLETGTLTWSDVATGSEWETSTKGFGATIGTGGQGAAGTGPLIKPTLRDGDSDTGSARPAISPGQIIITKPDEQTQDIAELNRDTSNTNDTIDALPDLQKSLNEQLKTQQEWSQAAAIMATAVRDFSDKQVEKAKERNDPKTAALWEDGGPARAALHAIAGGLLGGVNGVDGAIKSAIGAGVSTIIAPHIKRVVDQAVAQSGLTGVNAKRVSDALTSSIVLGLLSGSGSSDATAYTSNEIKYNYLTAEQWKQFEDEMRDNLDNWDEIEEKYRALDAEQEGQMLACETEDCLNEHIAKLLDGRQYLETLIASRQLSITLEARPAFLDRQLASGWEPLDSNYNISLSAAGVAECTLRPAPDCRSVGQQKYRDDVLFSTIVTGLVTDLFSRFGGRAWGPALRPITSKVTRKTVSELLENLTKKMGGGSLSSGSQTSAVLAGVNTAQMEVTAIALLTALEVAMLSQSANGDGGSSSNDSGSSSGGTNNTNKDPLKEHGQKFRDNYDAIKNGKGTPRVNDSGQQKIFEGRQPEKYRGTNLNPNKSWKGAKEWDVPGSPNNEWRILEQKLSNGGTRWGITKDHYENIIEIKSLWEPAIK